MSNGFFQCTEPAGVGGLAVAGEDDNSAYMFQADVRPEAGSYTAGLVFNADASGSTMYYFGLYPAADEWCLYPIDETVWKIADVVRGTISGLEYGEFHTLKVVAKHEAIALYVDDLENPVRTLVSKLPVSGKVGFRTWKNGQSGLSASFDNARLDLITEYVYDKANQLIEVKKPDGARTDYTYDANGNRTVVDDRTTDHFSSDSLDGWTVSNMSVEYGQLHAAPASGEAYSRSADFFEYTDFESRMKMKSGNDVGLVVRAVDNNNMYLIRYFRVAGSITQPTLCITRITAGNGTTVAWIPIDSSQAGADQWYSLKARVDGSKITASYTFNGEISTVEYTDPTPFTKGSVGVRSWGAGHYHFDDATITARTAYTYDRANQLTQVMDASGTTTNVFRYDNNGNTLFDAVSYSSYSYNEINRLTGADSLLRGSVSYGYDALGRLASRSFGQAVFADDFSGTPDGWNQYDAGWSRVDVSGDPAYQGVSGTAATVSWRSDETGDMAVTAKVKICSTTANNATAGLVVRSGIQPGSLDRNEYYFGIYPHEDKWKLFVTNASGGFTLIQAGTRQIDLGQFYTLKATADTVAGQPSIELFIDDLLVAVFSDTVAGPHTGKAGLRVRAATAVFDDFRLESLPPVTSTTRYVYNEVTGALLHELDGEGKIVATYVTDDKGDPVSVTRFFDDNGTPAAKTYFYHYNVHGDVIALTGENGQQVATFSYDAWGVPTEYDAAGAIVAIGAWTTATGGTPGDTLYFLFGGMLYDAVAGLYITKTRAYNPKTGRFLQRDILDEKGKDGVYAGFPFGQDAIGTNLYAWCKNNPTNMVDPSGLLTEEQRKAIGIGVVYTLGGALVGLATGGPAGIVKGAAWGLGVGLGAWDYSNGRGPRDRNIPGYQYGYDNVAPKVIIVERTVYETPIIEQKNFDSWSFNDRMYANYEFKMYGQVLDQNGEPIIFHWKAQWEPDLFDVGVASGSFGAAAGFAAAAEPTPIGELIVAGVFAIGGIYSGATHYEYVNTYKPPPPLPFFELDDIKDTPRYFYAMPTYKLGYEERISRTIDNLWSW